VAVDGTPGRKIKFLISQRSAVRDQKEGLMNNLKNPHQRVGVFVDVQNLYYSAKALYGHKVNFDEILKEAISDRQLIRAIAYTIKADMPEEQSFFDALESIGFEVKSKELQTFVSGQKKGDWDVGIAVDVLKLAPKLDVIVLCSGDGDYAELLHHAKAEGCRAEVISFGKSTSAKLLEEVDDFIDIDKGHDRFILKNKPTSTNGNPKKSSPRPKKNKPPVAQPETKQETITTTKKGWFK
jgi:uncharacterized LabA/DUF88 family protein